MIGDLLYFVIGVALGIVEALEEMQWFAVWGTFVLACFLVWSEVT